MTAQMKSRRVQAVKLADALNAIAGVPVTEYAKILSWCWAEGKMTGNR